MVSYYRCYHLVMSLWDQRWVGPISCDLMRSLLYRKRKEDKQTKWLTSPTVLRPGQVCIRISTLIPRCPHHTGFQGVHTTQVPPHRSQGVHTIQVPPHRSQGIHTTQVPPHRSQGVHTTPVPRCSCYNVISHFL